MTVSFHTLGCKLNFAETSTISRLFVENGYTKLTFGQPADVVVINTCTVTAQSERKCRQAITKAVKTSPEAVVVVVGCFAELKATDIAAIPGVDLVLGNEDKFDIIKKIENQKSKIENQKSKIENQKSKIENRKSKIKNSMVCLLFTLVIPIFGQHQEFNEIYLHAKIGRAHV